MGQNLVSRQEYKTYAGISSPNHDAEIDLILPKVSQLVKTYCQRSFLDYVNDPKVQISSGNFVDILLEETPVLQVLSVEQSLDYGASYTTLTEVQDWFLDFELNTVSSTSQTGFKKLRNGYKITYFAGYEQLPEDLKLAVFDLISYYRKNDGAVHNSKAPGVNGVQVEYVLSSNFPAHIRRVLDQYRASYI